MKANYLLVGEREFRRSLTTSLEWEVGATPFSPCSYMVAQIIRLRVSSRASTRFCIRV
jgi:hypothetical protein